MRDRPCGNEIDLSIPLIQGLDIEEAVVTIDAKGCQTAVAPQITQKRGHYLLALNSNQEALWEEVQCAFKANVGLSAQEAWCYDRARFEERRCRILAAAQVLDPWFTENLSTLRKLALQLLTQQADRWSLQKRRVRAAFDLTYLKKIICWPSCVCPNPVWCIIFDW